MASIAQKKRLERLLRWKQDGVKALSEHGRKEQATRLLTAKLSCAKLASDTLALGTAFSSAFSKPRLTAGIDPA